MKSEVYQSINSLSEVVSRLMDKGDSNRALRLMRDFVERIITEPLCTAQVFGSQELDGLCQRIGKANFADVKREIADAGHNQSQQPIVVYIVTKLQKSGGHSRVIEDFIKAQPSVRHVILSTELEGGSDIECLEGLAQQANIAIEQAPKVSYQQRLTWLQSRLLEIHPKRIYLFNHHQDSVAVAAVQAEMGIDVSFYHHGDHHLCLGVHLPFAEHIDPHPMGFHCCRHEFGIANTYIPLTIDDMGARPSDRPFMQDGVLTTCTAARSNKIEAPYFISYLDVVPALLKITGGRHIHIGRLTPWALFKIRRGLKRHGVPPDKFVYKPWVPSVWKALHDFHVDLYIASFPYGGGLTLIEAMGAGVPVALHHHIFSRVLSSIDLAPMGAFGWRYPADLLKFCANVTPGYLQEQGQRMRTQYLGYHRQQILADILASENRMMIPHPDLQATFQPQRDEFAVWIERQISIGHLVRRTIYRFMLNLRAKFF